MAQQDYPILYSFRRCPYAMRARLALAASGQSCVLREVLLRDKPAAMLEASAKATVPVLVLSDGTVLDESLDIMTWALGRRDPEGWCSDDSPGDTAVLIARCDNQFKFHLDRYKYPGRYPDDTVSAEDHRDQACDFLADLDARLTKDACIEGSSFGMADAAILPFVRQFAAVDRAWFDSTPYGSVRRWLETFLASNRFKQIMHKYAVWQPGDATVLFPLSAQRDQAAS